MKNLKTNLFLLITFFFTVSLTVSCNEEENPEPEVKVYVVGSIQGKTTPSYARCWKNSESILFDESEEYQNTSSDRIFVSDNDIHIAGMENSRIVYWKNNEKIYITDGKNYAMPTSIFVDNNDVYISGYELNENNISVAKYWKNGVPVMLSDGLINHFAGKLVVSNGDVYVAIEKNENYSNIGMYMKNNEVIQLPNSFQVFEIYVNGSDVYVAGATEINTSTDVIISSSRQAAYWKNGEMTVLGDIQSLYSTAIAIELSGNDVIVAGTEAWKWNVNTIVYWRNGMKTTLTDGENQTYLTGLCMHNDDIYISGYEFGPITDNRLDYILAKYWKNDEGFVLSDSLQNSLANDIFVTEN